MTNTDQRSFLPYGKQHIEADDVAAVTSVLTQPLLTTGPKVSEFGTALAQAVGASYATPCSSGTAALHLAALALNLGPGDRAIVPAITFVATANAIRYTGAEIVFSDVDPDTGLMTPALLEEAISKAGAPAARAVFPVHMAGQCADPEGLHAISRKHGMHIVDDAAHAIGTSYITASGEHLMGSCAHADMTAFSFHPVKTIAMAEGGAVTTNDPGLRDRLNCLVSHGLVRNAPSFRNSELALDAEGEANPWYYELHELGFNYRASDIHCALGRSQLAKLSRFVARRRALVVRYAERLAPLAPHIRLMPAVPRCKAAWHLAIALIDFKSLGVERAAVMRQMREEGIGTQVLYVPVNRQPYYSERYRCENLPGADRYYERTLALPLFYDMEDGDVDRVADALARATKLA